MDGRTMTRALGQKTRGAEDGGGGLSADLTKGQAGLAIPMM